MSVFNTSKRLNLRPETQGTSPRFCQNCGLRPHEHDKERITKNGRFGYEYICPEDS